MDKYTIICISIIIVIVIFNICYKHQTYYDEISNIIDINTDVNTIYDVDHKITYPYIKWYENEYMSHIIITRYNEPDISRILKPFINKKNVTVFIYNKGQDIPFGIPDDATNVKMIQIPNLGWDSYGYVSHVINNYDNIPDFIFSIHASAETLINKFQIYLSLINLSKDLDRYNINKFYYGGNIVTVPLDFRIYNHISKSRINRVVNKFEQANIYPLYNWIKSKISKIPENVIVDDNHMLANYYGMFCVNKKSIMIYPKEFYINILDEISVWQSEVNHYLERSWYTFYS